MKIWAFRIAIVSICFLVGCKEETPILSNSEQSIPVHTIPSEVVEKPNLTEDEDENNNDIQPITVTLKNPKTLEIVETIYPQKSGYDTNFEMYLTRIKNIAKDLARGTDNLPGFDQQMKLDKMSDDGQIIKGSPRIILKESELVDHILAASDKGGSIFLPIYITESNYNVEDIPNLDDVIIASFKTYFNPADTGRNKNIELSTNALNNIIVGNGDYFSFNTMVGERTEERGFQPAPEIINKKLVMGIGGGICQTSSTLFNAVDQVGVRITERHHHSLNVGYVATGRDATVSYGTLDFKFQNISGAPFLIKTVYENDHITIEIRTALQYKSFFINS